jgi:hypothetical protein
VAVIDLLQAVLKSLILSNLAGIEDCEAVEVVAIVGVDPVVTTCVVVDAVVGTFQAAAPSAPISIVEAVEVIADFETMMNSP